MYFLYDNNNARNEKQQTKNQKTNKETQESNTKLALSTAHDTYTWYALRLHEPLTGKRFRRNLHQSPAAAIMH